VAPDGDLISFGSPDRERRGPRWPGRPPRWAGWLLLGGAVTAGVIVLATGSGRPHRPAPRPAVTVTETGRRLLGVRARWELFGFGPAGVLSIQPATGRITRTAIPPLDSTGPVSFLVGPHQAIVRPLDFVPGYLVPDGQPARALTGLLNEGGPALPGPRPDEVWVVTGDSQHAALTLARLGGQRLASVPIPIGGPVPLSATPDGSGGVLLTGPDGTFDVQPGGLRRVSLQPLAVGPGRWLAVTCPGHRHRCADIVIDSATGAQRTLPGPVLPHTPLTLWPPGVIAPDGAAAAVLEPGPGGLSARLLDLRSGASRVLNVAVSQDVVSETMAWSPDSRWLFVVTGTGAVRAVNASTGQVSSLTVQLPFISQIAVRTAPG
jgi:hypothetical protein